MTHVYQHEQGCMYKRKDVKDPQPYLDDGWFLSISDHEAHVAKLNRIPVETHLFDAPPVTKPKRKTRKQAD